MTEQRPRSIRNVVASPGTDWQRHSKFYFDNTLVTIGIENTLFSVHKYQLMKSEVFADMFDTAQRDTGEGSSADKPIVLEGVSASDFECLLTVLYAPHFSDNRPTADASLIIPAFRLASMWSFKNLRAHLLPLANKELDDVDKIVFARKFSIPEWLVQAHTKLCQRTVPLTSKEAEKLGVQSVLLIHRIREEVTRAGFAEGAKACATCLGHTYLGNQQTNYNGGMGYHGTPQNRCSKCNVSGHLWSYHNKSSDESLIKPKVEKWVGDGCVFGA